MSTYCDKIIGYSIDILNEWESLDDNIKDNWESAINNELEFTGYDNSKHINNRLTIIYDGMDGCYCKLFFVVDSDIRGGVDDDEDIVRSINELLSISTVPFDVKQKIKRVYKELFGKDLEMTSKIKATYLVHWH